MHFNTRKILISALAIPIIGIALYIAGVFSNKEKPEMTKALRKAPVVATTTVKNTDTPIRITANGNLEARDRVELFAEVQGIFEYSTSRFDPGMYFEKGSILARINSDEHRANLRAQKSQLYNQLVAILPDMRFDYPEVFPKWERYVAAFNPEQPLTPLPTTENEREKLFIVGRNLQTQWYQVKNLENRLQKYTIYAPFSGVLTEALIDKGALIRAGQKMGTFINPSVYEIAVGVSAQYADLLQVGKTVRLHNANQTKTWQGKINRLNKVINPNTQTLQAYITVSGKDLREGMYLEAELTARQEPNTLEVPRNLLINDNQLYYVRDTVLELTQVEPIYFNEDNVVVKGLPEGMQLLSKVVPGAYEGMVVTPSN